VFILSLFALRFNFFRIFDSKTSFFVENILKNITSVPGHWFQACPVQGQLRDRRGRERGEEDAARAGEAEGCWQSGNDAIKTFFFYSRTNLCTYGVRRYNFFLVQTYQNGNNIPKDHKLHQTAMHYIYQMDIKYTTWPKNITFSIPRLSKIYTNWDFGS
jgi:hypothetical protein